MGSALPRTAFTARTRLPSKASDHFYGLREAKPDLVGFALFERISRDLPTGGPLWQMKWARREIENYLCYRETLIAFAEHAGGGEGPLFEAAERDRRRDAMIAAIKEVTAAREVLGQPDPFADETKASDDCLGPVFQNYFKKLGLSNLMQKTDYHSLVQFVPADLIAPEVREKLDELVQVAKQSHPVT